MERRYFRNDSICFGAFTCNHQEKKIFIAEYQPNPTIFMLDYDLNVIDTIENVAQLEIENLKYDHRLKQLYIFCKCPENEIKIYSFADEQLISIQDQKLELCEDFLSFQINPTKKNEFLILRKNQLELYRCTKNYTQDEESEELFPSLSCENLVIQIEEIYGEQFEECKFLDICWLKNDLVYISNSEGQLTLFNLSLNKVENQIIMSNNVTNISLNSKYLFLMLDEQDFRIYEVGEDLKIIGLQKFCEIAFPYGKIQNLVFNQNFEKMFIVNKNNSLIKAQLPIENYEDSEDMKEDDAQSNLLSIEINFTKIGQYHSKKIIIAHNFSGTNILMTLDEEGFLYLWNLQSKVPLIFDRVTTDTVTSAVVQDSERRVIITTDCGLLMFYKFNKEQQIEEEEKFKLFKEDSIDRILLNERQNILSLQVQDRIVILKNDFENLQFYGVLDLYQQNIQDLCFHTLEEETSLAVLFEPGIVFYYKFDFKKLELSEKIQDMNESHYEILIRKIDPDLNKISFKDEQPVFLAVGTDHIVKQYNIPQEKLKDFNKATKYPKKPLNEFEIIETPVQIFDQYENGMVFGTSDGNLVVYDTKEQSSINLKVMSYKQGGISFLQKSPNYNLFLVGGFDGSFSIVKGISEVLSKEFEMIPENLIQNLKDDSVFDQSMEEEETEFYEEILQEKFRNKIFEEKRKVQTEVFSQLEQMQNQFQKLYQENQGQDELKKLEFEQFCIDHERRDRIKKEEVNEIKEIFSTVKEQQMRNNLIHLKIKSKTHDKMDQKMQTLTGLEKKLVVMNFPTPKQEAIDEKTLKKIQILRRLEVREKNFIMEEDPDNTSFFQVNRFISNQCKYLINGRSGRPDLILQDYEAREQAIKEYLEEQKKKMESLKNKNNALRTNKKTFEIKNRRQRKKKRMVGGAAKGYEKRSNLKKQATTAYHSFEMREGEQDWMYLYPSIEIFSRFKKINQIYFIKNIVSLVKVEFNQRFDEHLTMRDKKIDLIKENNKKMEQIYKKLEKVGRLYSPFKNIIEKTDNILKITDNEISIKKYLTHEEKRRIEEERLKEEKRIAEINADDSNIRALKMMMNNTLEEKKENILQKEIEKEDWMDTKKFEDMTEEERLKFSEYQEKQEELKQETEKLRKILNQELKKFQSVTNDLISNFDNKVSILFMQKLEYTYRIFEQELFMLKLKKSLYREDLIGQELKLTEQDIQNSEVTLEQIKSLIQVLSYKLQEKRRQKQQKDSEVSKQENKLMRQIFQTIMPQREDYKKKKFVDDVFVQKIEKQKSISFVNTQDPYLDWSKRYFCEKYLYDEQVHEQAVRDMVSRKVEGEEAIQSETNKFFKYLFAKRESDMLKTQLATIDNIYKQYENFKQTLEVKIDGLKEYSLQETKEFEKLKKNVFLMVRLPNEKIEIQTNKVIPLLNDIILIDSQRIQDLNTKIQNLGNDKVVSLKKNLEEKQKVEADLIELKILKKEIKESLIESAILTRLKVNKRLQQALNKKNENLIELEEKNVKKQVEKIISSTEKQVATLNKKELTMRKEIKYLQQENQNLIMQGGVLQESVNQRREIFTMIFNENPDIMFENENDDQNQKKNGEFKKDEVGYKKAMELAKNRKLFDIAKKLAHEIENLMMDLKTLKERTFPNLG